MPSWPAVSPSFPSGIADPDASGGGGNPDLVSGGAATNGSQAKAAGTTTSDAITFQAPTGGSGASTPSAVFAHVVGSGATLSGSGLGPYTVNGLADGDVVRVTCTHTDDGDGQVVEDVAVVDVAVPADLVSGGAATNGSQAKAAGTTSSDAITFQAPTGGSGASTPSVALAHVAGTGASLSGSGLGPYTVNGLQDGDTVTVTCTHTDDGDGQVVEDVAVVAVAAVNPDLVSGGNPTNGTQAKASGTTSSDAITFQAPTGGSGASTPSAALAHVVGAGATLSGSGLGPYTVNSLEDGDAVTVTCTHTDDGDGQVVKDVAVVDVAAAVVTRAPELIEYIDFTAGDAQTWTSASTSGTITDNAGATTLATWARIQAVGGSTGFSYESGGGVGFGLATGLETTTTGVTLGIRIDPVWTATLDDLDGYIVAIVFDTQQNTGTPPSGRDEMITVAACPNGSAVGANHTLGVRIYHTNSGAEMQRYTAGAYSETTAVTYPTSGSYVLYVRLDRYDGRTDIAFDEAALLSADTIDGYAYDYSRIGATAITGDAVADGPYAKAAGVSLQFSVRNDWPTADGGGETQIHIKGIALYSSGVAQ